MSWRDHLARIRAHRSDRRVFSEPFPPRKLAASCRPGSKRRMLRCWRLDLEPGRIWRNSAIRVRPRVLWSWTRIWRRWHWSMAPWSRAPIAISTGLTASRRSIRFSEVPNAPHGFSWRALRGHPFRMDIFLEESENPTCCVQREYGTAGVLDNRRFSRPRRGICQLCRAVTACRVMVPPLRLHALQDSRVAADYRSLHYPLSNSAQHHQCFERQGFAIIHAIGQHGS